MKKFSVHPVSIIIWIWLFLCFGIIHAANYLLAILFHELGHFFVAKLLGYSLKKFAISPYGFSLSYIEKDFDFRDELKIAAAGPLANFITAFFVFGVWWLFPTTYFFTESFVSISLILALFNLLPAYPLDGGRIFINISSYFVSDKVAKKITMIFNLFLSLLFLILFVIFLFINFNPTYLLFSFFLLVGVFELNFGSRYEKINVLKKTTKNFVRAEICCVNSSVTIREILKKMQTSKTKLFCLILENGRIINLSEKMIINLSINFSYDCKLEEIFEKH